MQSSTSTWTIPENHRFRDDWYKNLKKKYQTKEVFTICNHIWPNMTFSEFELWFSSNAEDVFRRAEQLRQSVEDGYGTIGFEFFTPPGQLLQEYQWIWENEPLEARTRENWTRLRNEMNTNLFEDFLAENQHYRVRFEALQDLHISEYLTSLMDRGYDPPVKTLTETWEQFYNNLPADAQTAKMKNELINTVHRIQNVPPNAWWAHLNPVITPQTPNDFVNALCRRLKAELNYFAISQERYPFHHTTYLGIELDDEWRDFLASSDIRYRTSDLWAYVMETRDVSSPGDMVEAIEFHEDLRSKLRPEVSAEGSDHGEQPQQPHQKPPPFQPGLTTGEASYGAGDDMDMDTGLSIPYDATPYESTPFDSTPYDSTPYSATPLGPTPPPYNGPFHPPDANYRAPDIHPPPQGYSCLSNSTADAAPSQKSRDPTKNAAGIFNDRKKPRLIGSQGPVQALGNYGFWGKYVDDGPQKDDETLETYVERANRARDNMRIQLRLRPDPPARNPYESHNQYQSRLQNFEQWLTRNEEEHTRRMNYPDRSYRDGFQQLARQVDDQNAARRFAARTYWNSEVNRLHENFPKEITRFKKKYLNYQDLEVDEWNLYEGFGAEAMRRGESALADAERDDDEDEEDEDEEEGSPCRQKQVVIRCARCKKDKTKCSARNPDHPLYMRFPCTRCSSKGESFAAMCQPETSEAPQLTGRRRQPTFSSTRGPYLVSWWARDLGNVPRAPPPPDHWGVRAQESFYEGPPLSRPGAPAPYPAAAATASQRPVTRQAASQSLAPPPADASGATGNRKRGRRSDAGRKHNYPKNRKSAKASANISRSGTRTRSASPSRDARPFRERSPLRSSGRKCRRCMERNRMCSASSLSDRPCVECCQEGPATVRRCIAESSTRNEPGPPGFGDGHRGGSMGSSSSGGGGSYQGHGGGSQPGYDNAGSFDGFQPYGQPTGSYDNNQNHPTMGYHAEQLGYVTQNTDDRHEPQEPLNEEESRLMMEWENRVPDPEEARQFDEIMAQQEQLITSAFGKMLANSIKSDVAFVALNTSADEFPRFQYVGNNRDVAKHLDEDQYNAAVMVRNIAPLSFSYPRPQLPAVEEEDEDMIQAPTACYPPPPLPSSELRQAAFNIAHSQTHHHDPLYDTSSSDFTPPLDPALQDAVPALEWDDPSIPLASDIPPLTSATPDISGPPTPSFSALDDTPKWKIHGLATPNPSAELEVGVCTEDLDAGNPNLARPQVCGKEFALKCQHASNDSDAACAICHSNQAARAGPEEAVLIDKSKAPFCAQCEEALEKARQVKGGVMRGLRLGKCHCFMQLQDTWLCNVHRRAARQDVRGQIALKAYLGRSKMGKCGRCERNEGVVKEVWRCVVCENVVLAHA